MSVKRYGIAVAAATLAFSVVAIARDLNMDQVDALVAQGTVLSIDKLNAAALAAHPGGSLEQGAEIEQHRRGYIYEVEITDANGTEWELELDAATGKILKNERD